MEKVADGKSTKIVIPSELQNIASLGVTLSEIFAVRFDKSPSVTLSVIAVLFTETVNPAVSAGAGVRAPFQHHFGRPSLSGNCRKIFLAHPCPRRPGGFRVLLRTPRPVRCSGGRHRCSLLFGLGGKHPAGQCLPAATCGDSLLSPCQSPI